jgi:hypothetical protein
MTELDSAAPRRLGRVARAIVVGLVGIVLVGAGVVAGVRLADRPAQDLAGSPSATPPATVAPTSSTGAAAQPIGPTAVLLGAGDIAACGSIHDEETAALIESIPGIVFTTGDNAYLRGSAAEFRKCYDPSWGEFRWRTRPAIGNHDVLTDDGAPYFAYFGTAAGTAPDGWYSYEAGTWHVIVLNSNCNKIGGCGNGSPQLTWLEADLAAHPAVCTLAIWHHPRFTSGEHGDDPITNPFWQVLYEAHAELILNGHDHDYERFAPQTPSGDADPVNGIREFVVGTGGKSLRLFNPAVANSEVRAATSYGILRLDLAPGSYAWHFLTTSERAFSDNGSASCH